jgi:hypothetical protein
MKTQKIKIVIDAEVPVGKHCYSATPGGKWCAYLTRNKGNRCNFLPWKKIKLKTERVRCEIYLAVIKCQQCLDACKENK